MSYYDPDLNKQVLAQDVEQVSQATKKARESREKKEQQEYDTAVKEYEKDVAAAEAQYQKDLAEYNKQQEAASKQQNQYDAEIQRLQAAKDKDLADAHYAVWGPGGSRNRSDLKSRESTIINQYESLINKAVEQKRVETGYQEFSALYPGQVLPRNVAETFRKSPSFSLTGLYQTKIEGKAAKAEYQRQASAQTAQNIGAKMSVEYHSNIPSIGFISSGLGTERGAAVKATPEKIPTLLGGGKKAVETRRPLINVKTHETIYGGQQIETNPRAFVASLDRQNVNAAGLAPERVQEKPKNIFSFENVSEVKDPSAIALLEFQQQLKTRTAPSATVYKGILEDKGLPVTPLASRIIDTYSSKGLLRGYTEPKQAKGRKAIISKDGKQLFDMETGIGSVRIGRLLGYKYSKPIMVTELGKDIQGPPQALWAIPDAFGNPRTDASGNPIYLTEESAKKLSERFAEKESEFVIPVIGGEQKLKVTPPKMSELGKEIQRGYKQLDEESILLAKTPKSENPFLAAYQYVAPVGIAAGKSIYAGLAFGVNQAEQVQAPFYRNLLGLKPAQKTAPIVIGDASGVVVLPINFEKLDIRKPETYGPSLQNPLEKEYQQKQLEYIKKYGPLEYVSGIVFDYGGLKGAAPLLKTGVKSAPKLVTKIASPKRQLITTKGGIVVPSKTWDITEKIGFRKGIPTKSKVPQIGKVTTQQPVPNPFGKERVIPYNLQKAKTRFTESLQAGKAKAVQVGGKVKTAIQKDIAFPNRSLIEGKNIEIPNITRPAKPEFSKTLESARIGLEMKRSSLAKRLSEMENIYRGGIDTPIKPYSKRLESLGIGLRIKRQEFAKGISSVGKKIPELKTPKGIIKFKKQVSFIAKRTSKGIETRKQNLIKSFGKLKPTIKAPYLPQKTSLEIAKFKQKEKLDATLARMRKVATPEEKPKVVVPKLSSNFLSNIKKRFGVSEPLDFKSVVKPFQKPNLRKEFASNIRGAPIGKIKGTTSRKEFARLLTERKERRGLYNLSNITTKAGFGIKEKSVKEMIGEGIAKEQRVAKLRDVKALRFPSQITTKAGFGRKIPSVKELAKEGEFKQARFIELQKQERFSAPFTKAGFGIKEKSVKEMIGEGMYKQKRFEQLQKQERFSAPFTKAGFGIKQKSVKEMIGEGLAKSERIRKIKNVDDLKAPAQTIKPIFPVPRKPTELENILEGFKKEKKTGQPYKQVRIDKYVPKYPKSWEAWRGVGIVTAAGTISALGLGSEKAEALPFASITKIGSRQIESGGQILIFKESKDFGKVQKPFLVPPTLKERQQEDEDNILLARRAPRQVQTVLPKVSFEFSTPQRVQESIKMKTIQPAKISSVQSTPQKTRQREKQRTRQISKPKYETIALTRITPKLKAAQTPKLSSPLAPKTPTKLKAPQRQPLKEKPIQITLLRTRPPRKPPRVIFALPDDKEKKKKERKTEKQEIGFYLGNVPETQISGMFRRKEITLGKEKIQKERSGDVRVLLGKPRKESRKKKQEYVLGFKVPKTKFF